MLSVASLFSGVGGIDLGFHSAGVPTRLLCEYDKAARSVLARRFPGVPIHPDVTELTADDLAAAGLRPESTIITAGFPCQDLSVAGARRGMGEGTRSGLYWHVDRLLGGFRPAWVVLENVPGLLSATCACPGDGRCGDSCEGGTHSVAGGGPCPGGCIPSHGGVMGAVLGSLAERGYGFAYRVLDAQHFGVPQRRRRVVIVGRLGDSGAAPAQVLLEPEGSGWNPPAGLTSGSDPAGGAARSAGDTGVVVGSLTSSTAGGWRIGADEAAAGQLVVQSVTGDRTHALTSEGADASEDGTGRGTPIIAATLTAGTSRDGVSAPGRRQEDDHIDLTGGAGVTTVRRLTPLLLECERLQGFPDGWTDGQADSARYRQMGNAVAVPVFAWVARRLAAVDAAGGGLMTWREQAACAGTDPAMWFPEDIRSPTLAAHATTSAVQTCHACPVRDACLAETMRTEKSSRGHRHGIYGGLTPAQRQELAVGMKRKPLAPCGTRADQGRAEKRGA